MTIDFWSLGLQTINVLILVWLLSHFFWRPVAAAINKRQEAAQALLSDAQTANTQAEAALADLTTAREGIAAEREAMLADATKTAENAASAALATAHKKAETLIDAAQRNSAKEADVLRAELTSHASLLAVDIAQKLLTRLPTTVIQSAFLGLLIEAIGQLSAADRQALVSTADGLDVVSAADLTEQDKEALTQAMEQALGNTPALTFHSDPDLMAGLEIRTPHFALHNSWQSDLATIVKALNHDV